MEKLFWWWSAATRNPYHATRPDLILVNLLPDPALRREKCNVYRFQLWKWFFAKSTSCVHKTFELSRKLKTYICMYYVLYNFYMNVLYTGMDREEGLHTLEGIWIELDTIILKMWNKKCHLSKTEILGCRDPRYKHENSSIFSKSME